MCLHCAVGRVRECGVCKQVSSSCRHVLVNLLSISHHHEWQPLVVVILKSAMLDWAVTEPVWLHNALLAVEYIALCHGTDSRPARRRRRYVTQPEFLLQWLVVRNSRTKLHELQGACLWQSHSIGVKGSQYSRPNRAKTCHCQNFQSL